MKPSWFRILTAVQALIVRCGLIVAAISSPGCSTIDDWRRGSGICEVHHVAMQTQVVHGKKPGCLLFTGDFIGARIRDFPNSGIHYPPSFYKRQQGKIYTCLECIIALDDYEKRH